MGYGKSTKFNNQVFSKGKGGVYVPGAAPAEDYIVPGPTDVIQYFDNFAGYNTIAARHTQRDALIAAGNPFYFYDGPKTGEGIEYTHEIKTDGGLFGSNNRYRINVDFAAAQEGTMAGFIFSDSDETWEFAPDDALLFVEFWVATNIPLAAMHWIKGIMLWHSFDRSQYGPYQTGASLQPMNFLAQSGPYECHGLLENGAPDAPVTFKRWAAYADGNPHKWTAVFKKNTTQGVTSTGVAQIFIDEEMVLDVSNEGQAVVGNPHLVDRVYGVAADSKTPYPGNAGEKYSNTTAIQCLRSTSDDPVIAVEFPGIFDGMTASGSYIFDTYAVRVWYRP